MHRKNNLNHDRFTTMGLMTPRLFSHYLHAETTCFYLFPSGLL